jgi:tetratricopeptide (TPR) repeat protein
MQRRLSPGDHVGTASTLDLLATALVARGDRAQAEAIQLEALAMRRRMFPESHPDIALGLHNLASGLRIAGEFERAEPFARDAVESGRRVFPADHPNLPVFDTNLGLILEARGDLDGAIRTFQAVVEREDRFAGTAASTPPERVAKRERNLLRVLASAGRFADAEALIGRFDSASAGRTSDRTLQLAELHEAWDRAQPGAGHADRARELRRSLEGSGGSSAR